MRIHTSRVPAYRHPFERTYPGFPLKIGLGAEVLPEKARGFQLHSMGRRHCRAEIAGIFLRDKATGRTGYFDFRAPQGYPPVLWKGYSRASCASDSFFRPVPAFGSTGLRRLAAFLCAFGRCAVKYRTRGKRAQGLPAGCAKWMPRFARGSAGAYRQRVPARAAEEGHIPGALVRATSRSGLRFAFPAQSAGLPPESRRAPPLKKSRAAR